MATSQAAAPTNSPTNLPTLAPPGAGIPAIERWIGGFIFAFSRWRGTPDQFTARFLSERQAIRGLYTSVDEARLKRRVLIPRLRGLEDSSRFWSVWMTLDHLRIVNTQIAMVVLQLSRGRVPPGQVSTAAVKPSPDVGPEIVPAYEASCDELLAAVARQAEPHDQTPTSKPRYAHPWFGPLDAKGWHAMAAMHMGIHRAQIQRILQTISGG